jgi:hypothetical protein
MGHVRPHRWADALAGRVADDEHAAMTRHADDCVRCARARDRIAAATGTFPALKKEQPPDLGWDSIRARVHWDVSSARRSRPRISSLPMLRPRWAIAGGLGLLAAGAAAVGVVATRGAPIPPPTFAVAPPAAAKPAPLVGTVSRFAGEVMVDGIRRPDTFDHAVGAGTDLATGDGRVDVQFGDASALSLGPRSRLELRRFDAAAVELVVDGTVDVEVAPRAAGQTFRVIAGDRVVEVRGTQFRVDHEGGETRVACRHGRVAVRDAAGEVDVGAAQRLDVAAGRAVQSATVAAMSPGELAALADATPVTVPAGAGAATVELALEADAPRPVRVDGVELGAAPMRIRVAPGRHLVEAADAAGRFHRVEWVSVEADHPASVRVEIAPPPPAPTSAAADRRRQLLAGIDRARLARCVRRIVKDGIVAAAGDLAVRIEIGVDAAGAVNFLNLVDAGDLDAATAGCVHDALADVHFPAGGPATWQERIAL